MELAPNQFVHYGRGRRLLASGLAAFAIVLRWLTPLFAPKTDTTRVVLLEPFGLGDIISLQPLLDQLLQRNYSVVLCGKASWRPLFPERPGFHWIDSRIPWGTHDEKAKYRLGSYFSPRFWRFLKGLRVIAGGGIGLETRGDIRSSLILYLAGCRRVVSLSNYAGSNIEIPRLAAELVEYSPALRRWEMNLRFGPRISAGFLRDKLRAPVFPHLGRSATVPRRVGVISVAPWSGKLWARSRWKELIEKLEADGLEVFNFCGPGQEQAALDSTGRHPDCVATSIDQWSAGLSACAIVIAVDTGPMHLADALGIPVVALFGQGLLPLWAPSGQRSCVISHQDSPEFRPCQPVDGNAALGTQYMEKITVTEVLSAVLERV